MEINKIKELKFNRLKPEERFLIDIFDGLGKVESKKNKGHFLYVKDNYCYFYYKTGYLYYDYDKIRNVFNHKFDYNTQQNNIFVGKMVQKYLNMSVFGHVTWLPLLQSKFGIPEQLSIV